MTFFARSSSQFLNPPLAPSRKISPRFILNNANVDDVLSSDLEISFASNVSLNSPPREQVSLPSDCEPMDISPAPPVDPPSRLKSQSKRPRAFTSGARLFGNDISNNNPLFPSPSIVAAPTHKATGSTSAKRIQRAALPTEWLTVISVPEPPAHQVCVTRTTMECIDLFLFLCLPLRNLPRLWMTLWMLTRPTWSIRFLHQFHSPRYLIPLLQQSPHSTNFSMTPCLLDDRLSLRLDP
jgi:hypothetical protein